MSDPGKAVFLSYASQDAEAAKRICEALRAAGVEVWFDQSELVGGDQWDGKIRGQISSCALFVPIISANTQARLEGYFRREWKQAAARTHDMADEKTFLLPVVIDGTRDAEAKVPVEFKSVQWTKLPGGETPPAFAARVKKLLGGSDVGASLLSRHSPATADDDARGSAAPDGRAQGVPLQGRRQRWLAPVIAGGVIAILALIFARPWEKAATPSADLPARRSAPTTSETTEAQKLVAKAWALMNKPDLARAELEIAEGYCKRATELEPNDADAWAAWSQVDSWTVYHNFDASPGRREAARSKATHAMQIAAAGYEPRLAQACFLVRGQAGGDTTLALYAGEAEKLLRALLQEKTDEPRALLALGILLRNTGRFPECRDAFGRMARDPAFAAQAWNELGWAEYFAGDYAAAAAAIDRSIALQGYWGNLALKQILAQWWLGDLDLAKATLERMPMAARQEDIGIYSAIDLAYWRREPETMLQILAGVPRDWLQSNGFIGPTAWYAGLAHRLAGREAAAQVQWRTALALIERRLAGQPDSGFLLHWKAALLAEAGDRVAAEPVLKLAREIGTHSSATATVKLLAQLGQPDAAIDLLEESAGARRKSSTAAAFRLDPDLDVLRSNPRFQALLARMEADPQFSPKAEQKSQVGASSFAKASTDAKAMADKSEDRSGLPAAPDLKSVAVLPFANLSGDKEQEYFSDGLTEEILNALARERDLRVPGRTSSFSFKGKGASAAEIAKALNVARLVEGSVQRAGSRVRIRVALTRASDGFSEELGTFTEETADIFALYDKIARAVVDKVARRPATQAVAILTKNPEAYDAFLQGRALATQSISKFAQAALPYARAVELDPAFALAWAGLATARFARYATGQDRSPEVAAASRSAIDRALALQPDLPEALMARANWERHVNGDYAAARRDLARAEALQPPTAELRILQTWLERDLGNWNEAYRHARETMELDPRNGGNAFSLALSLYAERGDFLEADRLAAQANAISGTLDSQSYLRPLLRSIWRGPAAGLRLLDLTPERNSKLERARFLLALGRIDEVRSIVDAAERDGTFQRRLDVSSSDRTPEMSIMLQIGIGRPEAARRAAETIRAAAQQEMARGNRAPPARNALICAEIALDHREAALAALADWRREAQSWPNAFQRIVNFNWRAAKLHGSLAQADEAIALLQEYFAAGLQPPLQLRFDPSFAPIRSDPRFQKLIEQQDAWAKAQPDPVDP